MESIHFPSLPPALSWVTAWPSGCPLELAETPGPGNGCPWSPHFVSVRLLEWRLEHFIRIFQKQKWEVKPMCMKGKGIDDFFKKKCMLPCFNTTWVLQLLSHLKDDVTKRGQWQILDLNRHADSADLQCSLWATGAPGLSGDCITHLKCPWTEMSEQSTSCPSYGNYHG